MKTSVFVGVSLDGFIARPDGGIDWLDEAGSEPTESLNGGTDGAGNGKDHDRANAADHGYQAFIDTVDYLVMGRNTYEVVADFEPWPYPQTPVLVLTTPPLELPDRLADSVEGMSGSPQSIVDRLAERGAQHLYIDGGQTIQAFLRAGLIDELIITRLPILIGQGIPLFGPMEDDIHLRHIETRSFPTGLVQSRYVSAIGR